MIGKTISHYKILEKLGQGGMGIVYKAQDLDLNRFVALKFLPPHAANDHEQNVRFVTEAQAAAALDHPNVGTIYEIGKAEEQTFIAMAYIEGDDIAERMGSGPLDVNEALGITIQASEGLAAAHALGIVHRDVKSANVMVTPGGVAKVMDFGLAKISEATQLTQEGSSVGTASYMSPEQSQGRPVDHRTDIWALGVVLYEMLTGELPFSAEYAHAVTYAIINEAHKPVTDLRPELPVELAGIINRALEKDPDDRYQDIGDFAAELQAILEGRTSGMVATPPSFMRSLAKRPVLIVGTFLAVAVFILAGVLFLGKESSAHTRTVLLEDEEGQTVERVVPNRQYLKRITTYFFDNKSGNPELDWMQYAITDMVHTDLLQDMFVMVHYPYDVSIFPGDVSVNDRLKDAGHEGVIGVPLSLQRRVAGDIHTEHFVGGELNGSAEALKVTARVYKTETGRVVSEGSFEGDLFDIADEISVWLREAVGVPASHIEQTTDMPVAEMMTTSTTALRSYIEGANAFVFEDDKKKTIEMAKAALDEDETFVGALSLLHYAYALSGDFGKLEETVEAIMKYLHKVPERLQFGVKSGYFQIKGQTDKQIAVLRMATEIYPEDVGNHRMLARILEFMNQVREALAIYKHIVEIQPEYSEGLLTISRLHRRLGESEEALSYAQEYARRFSDEPDAHVELGEVYEELGQYENAKTHFEKADLLNPDQAAVLLTLSSLESKLGHPERASEHLAGVIDRCTSGSQRGRTFRVIGDFLAEDPGYREVLDRYETEAREKTNDVHALSALGGIYNTIGDWQRARSSYEKLVELEPTNHTALRALANIECHRTGDFDKALKLYDRALEACTNYSNRLSVWGALREFYTDQGQMTRALEYVEKICEPQGEDTQSKAIAKATLIKHLHDYVEAGQLEVAAEKLREVEEFFKPMMIVPAIRTVVLVGQLRMQLAYDDTTAALESVKQAVADLDKNRDDFRKGWGNTIFMLQASALRLAGDYDEAIAIYERLREDDWKAYAYSWQLGHCYLEMEQYDDAKRWLIISMEPRPHEPLTHYRLALAYDALGDRVTAMEHLNRCVDRWSLADADYEPALEARVKLAEWEQSTQ